ncbi:DinB family protein [Deinococcus sp. HMF7604]|uniref:DinB family protein n=1 Tax=Deinococcus betulae TaxID=2873312 RepID=UPI001CCF0EC0|nr:DinB family protein [Deinococcus betulae]MBZ9753414.1 DinB family protein [Deinococcus betulae]
MTLPGLATTLKDDRACEIVTLGRSPLTPLIAALVDRLTYARLTTLQAAAGMTQAELDAVPPGLTNSVGMLLAHLAAVHRIYQTMTFEGHDPYDDEAFAAHRPALDLGEAAQLSVRGHDLAWYEADLEATLTDTLRQLAARDDAWLSEPVPADPRMNHHWAWFHVMEDEVSHRGQIRLIRRLLRGQDAQP